MQQNILGLQISYFFSNTLCIHQRKTGQRHGGEKVYSNPNEFFPPTTSATSTIFETGCFGGGETLSKTWIQATL